MTKYIFYTFVNPALDIFEIYGSVSFSNPRELLNTTDSFSVNSSNSDIS